MNVTVVPFGNARLKNGKVTCQHGDDECKGNRWEQCAISHAFGNSSSSFAFIYCMEMAGDNMLSHVTKCAGEASLDYKALSACFAGPESDQLQKKAAADTPANHQYVPWVVVDGKHSAAAENSYKGLVTSVCAAYKGGAKPKECSNSELDKEDSAKTTSKCLEQIELTLLPGF